MPLYGNLKVQTQALPNAYLDEGAAAGQYAGGEIVGGALQGLGAHLKSEQDRIRAEEKSRANQIAVNQAVNEAKRAATDEWYGEGGLNDMQGEQLLAASGPREDAYAQRVRDIGAKLTPEQQQQYALYADDEITAFHNDLTRHVGAARIAVEDKSLKATQVTAIDGASEDAAGGALVILPDGRLDETSVGRERLYMEGQISEYVDRNQDRAPTNPAEWKQQLTEAARSDFHRQVINNAMPKHPQEAIRYFEEHKGEIEHKARAVMEKTVDRVQDDLAARGAVQQAVATHFEAGAFDPPVAGIEAPTLTERTDAAKAEITESLKEYPERQAKALVEFNKFLVAGKSRAKAQMNERHEALNGVLEQTGDMNQVRAREEWNQVTPEIRKSIEHASATRLKQDREDEQARHFYGLLDKATSTDPAVATEFRDMALLPSRPYMSKSQWDELSSIQKSMKGGDPKVLPGVRTRAQAVSHWVDKLYPKAGTEKGQTRHAFEAEPQNDAAYKTRAEFDAMIEAEQAKVGHLLSASDVDALIGPLFSDVVYKGWASAFDDTFPLASIGDIPKPTLLAIRKVLAEEGVEISDAEIHKRYAELVGSQ